MVAPLSAAEIAQLTRLEARYLTLNTCSEAFSVTNPDQAGLATL